MKFEVIRGIYFLIISFLLSMFFNEVEFLGSGFRSFSILTSVLQMNYFQIRISREWSQNSNYEKPYVRFNKRTGVFYRVIKKPRSEAVWPDHPIKHAPR